jgi:hypothetical protein
MAKKINIISSEEVLFDDLTEREKKIYNVGVSDGAAQMGIVLMIFLFVIGIAYIFISSKK